MQEGNTQYIRGRSSSAMWIVNTPPPHPYMQEGNAGASCVIDAL